MQLKWIVFLVMLWMVVSLLVGVAEGALFGGAVDPVTGEPQAVSLIERAMAGSIGERAGAFWSMLWFNFPAIFSGGWEVLRWVFLLPFSIAFGVMLTGYILAHIPVFGRGSG